jgi:hypothetical protein
MPVRIHKATTAAELDELFVVRHRVFAEEQGFFPVTSDGRLHDRFDAFPTTTNIVASVEGRIVGGVRIVEPSPVGTPADELFDFGPHLPWLGARVGSGSMLVMLPELRKTQRVTFAMLGMMYLWASSRGLTHVTGVAAPEAERIFLGSGYEPVAPRFFHEEKGLSVLPVLLDVAKLDDRFAGFVRRHDIDHFLHGFERQFHAAGETIVRAGDLGTSAYVIVDGTARVSTVSPSGAPVDLGALGPNAVFGELALLTDKPRSASVTAETDVDLMVLHRDELHRQLRANPDVGIQLLRLIGDRLTALTERVASA